MKESKIRASSMVKMLQYMLPGSAGFSINRYMRALGGFIFYNFFQSVTLPVTCLPEFERAQGRSVSALRPLCRLLRTVALTLFLDSKGVTVGARSAGGLEKQFCWQVW